MIKRIFALISVLIASFIMLAYAVIPHHHHNHSQICFNILHCHSDGKQPEHDVDHDHDCGSNPEFCLLQHVVVMPSLHDYSVFCNTNYNELIPDYGIAFSYDDPEILTSFSPGFSPGILFIHSCLLTCSSGLRAPPAV
jgi:hypothetical protein